MTELATMDNDRLTVWARDAAALVVKAEMTAQAQEAVRLLRGRIVRSDEEAAAVTDLVKRVKVGAKWIKEGLEKITRPLRTAADAARAEGREIAEALDTAEREGKKALDAWDAEKERAAREAERKRIEAEREAERIAAEAAVRGQVVAPPAEEPPPPPPTRVIHGAVGSSFGTSRVTMEMMDPHEVAAWNPALLKLDEMTARQLFLAAEKLQQLDDAVAQDGGLLWHGILFKREKSRAIK